MNLVGCVGIPDDQLSILRGGDQMTAVGGPVHSVNLGQVALKRATGLHSNSGEGVGLVGCDLADCTRVSVYSFKFELHRALCQSECPRVSIPKEQMEVCVYGRVIPGRMVVVREVSASSSFRRLILSFNPSASRLAAVILACICSPDISADIL